ncbi:glycogen synthase [Streptomyces lydicamycinicus]|uniref:Glycogen synthase n=1 Tax=Streptomyces lydicamycinicus TaxID=1546107 RepID=A0A0P4R1A5_9ACTN|nr:glycogen synthase [Streptomyces lydicamycinicus]
MCSGLARRPLKAVAPVRIRSGVQEEKAPRIMRGAFSCQLPLPWRRLGAPGLDQPPGRPWPVRMPLVVRAAGAVIRRPGGGSPSRRQFLTVTVAPAALARLRQSPTPCTFHWGVSLSKRG